MIGIPVITDEWEDLAEIGRTLAQAQDRNRWGMGDLAGRVQRRYGDKSLHKFANEINVRVKTLYDYHRVYHFYGENSARAENLTWSHHRTALKFGKLDTALKALDKASGRNWTTEQFDLFTGKWARIFNGAKAREVEPTPLIDTTASVARTYKQDDGGFIVLKLPVDMVKNVVGHHMIHLLIYEEAA